jgi:hypothetical protein
MALDNFEFAPAYRRAHRHRFADARRDQFGDELRLGFEEMNVGVPQRVVGVEDQMDRAAVAEPFVRVALWGMRRRICRSPTRFARRMMRGRRLSAGQLQMRV